YGYANKLSAGQVQSFMTTAPAGLVLPNADSHDTITRTFYDRDDRVIGALNAEGYLSRIIYDGAGRKIQEIAYVNATAVSMRTSPFDSLLNSFAHDAN